jgi:hypothetical protein
MKDKTAGAAPRTPRYFLLHAAQKKVPKEKDGAWRRALLIACISTTVIFLQLITAGFVARKQKHSWFGGLYRFPGSINVPAFSQ